MANIKHFTDFPKKILLFFCKKVFHLLKNNNMEGIAQKLEQLLKSLI